MSNELKKIARELKGRPPEELIKELNDLFGFTVPKVLRMAAIVRELDSQNIRVTTIRDKWLMAKVRAIAAGELLPEVFSCLIGHNETIDAMSRLPVKEQKRLMDAGAVGVLAGGEFESKGLAELRPSDLYVAFGPDSVRTESEQRQFVAAPVVDRPKLDQSPPPSPTYMPTFRVRPVPEKGGIKIGNTFAKPEEVVSALSELAGPLQELDVDATETETITTRLTAAEKERLRLACKHTGKLEWRLIREALHAYGLI